MRTLTTLFLVLVVSASLFFCLGEPPAWCESAGRLALPEVQSPSHVQRVEAPPLTRRETILTAAPRTISRRRRISGIVFDPSGRPVPDLEILAGAVEARRQATRSDAQGRFCFECGGDAATLVDVVVPATRGFDEATAKLTWGTEDFGLRLSRAGSLEILAVDHGTAIEHYGIAWAYRDHDGVWHPGREWSGHRPAGRSVLREVPAGPVRIVILPRAGTHAPNEPLEFVKPPGRCTISVAVPRRLAIPVVVRDGDGRPLVGVRVQLLRPVHERGITRDVELVDAGHFGAPRRDRCCAIRLDERRTDEAGRVALGWRRDRGPLVLRVLAGDGPVLVPATCAPQSVTVTTSVER